MKVEIFTLCDAATIDSGGKLNILGSFDHIWANQTPITHPLCALAIRIRFERLEGGQKRIVISFIDSDGRSVMPTLDAQISVQVPPSVTSSSVPFSLIMQRINLPSFGEYSIDLAVDGRQEASIPLFVMQSQLPPMTQNPPQAPV